jgi:hypothetical protein
MVALNGITEGIFVDVGQLIQYLKKKYKHTHVHTMIGP